MNDKVVVTPAMVSAGLSALWPSEIVQTEIESDVLERVYVAMVTASHDQTTKEDAQKRLIGGKSRDALAANLLSQAVSEN